VEGLASEIAALRAEQQALHALLEYRLDLTAGESIAR
jgi:hypothetical protein